MIAGKRQVKTVPMDRAGNSQFAEALASDLAGALDWWREAGVDAHFVDEPVSWLAPVEPMAPERPNRWPRAQAPAGAENGGRQDQPEAVAAEALPQDLEAFHAWWLGDTPIDPGGPAPRIAPEGQAGAKLMVLVDMPEPEDDDRLLGARQGQLLDAMLAAFGMDRSEVYLASVLPRALTVPDWEALARCGLDTVTRHHIRIAAPQRLMVLGGHILPLIGHEPPQRAAVLTELNQEQSRIPLLASWGLPALLQRPGGKVALWRTWLEWTGLESTGA